MDRFRLNSTYHLQTDKKSIINIPLITDCRVCRPFGNSKIPALLRTCTLRVAKLDRICFPSNFAKLFVDHITGLSLRFHSLACRFL